MQMPGSLIDKNGIELVCSFLPHSKYPGVWTGARNGVAYVIHPAKAQDGTPVLMLYFNPNAGIDEA
jgi:hypothetical protein